MAQNLGTRLEQFCKSAGACQQEALSVLVRILGNIVKDPSEAKFRRLNANSPKLKNTLLCHAGAQELLASVGFRSADDGFLQLPLDAELEPAQALYDAVLRLTEQRTALPSPETAAGTSGYTTFAISCSTSPAYLAALQGGAQNAGLAELEQICKQDGGLEALQVLERVLENIRRYPGSEKYRCINLAKAAGKNVMPAVALMEVAGFRKQCNEAGDDVMNLDHPNAEVLQRIWGMVWWASRGGDKVRDLPFSGGFIAHALGAILGFAIGDALGAPLGGQDPLQVTAAEVDKALEMCGGGIWGVAPGQVTGNSELLMCLTASLAEAPNPLDHFPLEDLAVRYGRWGKTFPFRADKACLQAFQRPLPADSMKEHAKEVNQKSESSGPLVRCIALAILGSASKSPTKAIGYAAEDALLSHPSRDVSYASMAYTLMAINLIRLRGDREAATTELRQWLGRNKSRIKSSLPTPKPGAVGFTHLARCAPSEEIESWVPPGEELVACEQLERWVNKGYTPSEELAFSTLSVSALLNKEVGSVEIPFTHALRHIKLGSSFDGAMRAAIAGGGDSSTNAAVVGGLIGAAVGIQGIPQRWLRAVLASDYSLGQFRPDEYHPGQLPSLVSSICAKPGCDASGRT